MKIYLAGPMTGQPYFNFPLFENAARVLRIAGHEVVSPAEHDIDKGWVQVTRDALGNITKVETTEAFHWDEVLEADEHLIDQCDAIYLLPGFHLSRGALRELKYARATNKRVLGDTPERKRLLHLTEGGGHQPLVGLVGYAQAGKDTFAGYLGYERIAFADVLKAVALASNPLVWSGSGMYDPFEAPDYFLQDCIKEMGWEKAKAEVSGVREFLQNLGVGVREHLGWDTWVNAAVAKYDPSKPTVFTDVRFQNEVDAIKKRGGVIVRITRIGNVPPNGHVSESLVATIRPDYEVTVADGDLEGLANEARNLDSLLRGTL